MDVDKERIMDQEIIILVGNVGSGKSTLARKLAKKGYVIICKDAIQQAVTGGVYALYDKNKKDIGHAMCKTGAVSALEAGFSVCIDDTSVTTKCRKAIIDCARSYTDNIRCIDLGCGSEEQLNRRFKYNRGRSEKTWLEVFNYVWNSYEKPMLKEGFSEIIYPQKQVFHAWDFDGTIVEHAFPEMGESIPANVNKIKELYESLWNTIIIWTCRSGEALKEMEAFLLKEKIPFDFINENPMFDINSPKIYADFYYDDRSIPICKKGE
jgi:predicted kinase